MIHFRYNKQIEHDKSKAVLLNINSINDTPLKNFAQNYRSLGGNKASDEVVNMVIRHAQLKLQIKNKYMSKQQAFLQTSKIIHSISKIKGKELWRLSNTFCYYHYKFQLTYSEWLFYRFIGKAI